MKLKVFGFIAVACIIAVLFSDCLYSEQSKVAYVDTLSVFEKYTRTQKVTDDLNAEIDARKNEIKTLEEEVNKLKDELKTQVLADEERKKKEDDIDSKTTGLKMRVEEIRDEYKNKESKLTKMIIDEIYDAIKYIAQKEGIEIVLEKQNLLYGSTDYDLTEKVIRYLNAQGAEPKPEEKKPEEKKTEETK